MLMMPIIGIEGILVVYKQAHLVFIYVLLSKIFTISCVLAAVYVSGASAVNAIIGLVLAYAMTSFVGFRLMYRPFKDIAVLQSCISIKDIFSYSIPVFNASVYGFIIGSASQFFVSRYFGVAEFAQFANGFMELPFAGVIIAVIASVMLPEFSRMYAAGTAKEEYILLWNRTVFQSASLIYPISIFCFIFAEDIITCLYGPKYGIASDLFRIITIINIARAVQAYHVCTWKGQIVCRYSFVHCGSRCRSRHCLCQFLSVCNRHCIDIDRNNLVMSIPVDDVGV